jgi:hypothetical protein
VSSEATAGTIDGPEGMEGESAEERVLTLAREAFDDVCVIGGRLRSLIALMESTLGIDPEAPEAVLPQLLHRAPSP